MNSARNILAVLMMFMSCSACAPLRDFRELQRHTTDLEVTLGKVAEESLEFRRQSEVSNAEIFSKLKDLENLEQKIEAQRVEDASNNEKRFEKMHYDIAALQAVLSGMSGTTVVLSSSDNPKILFGNHSGSHATVTLTNLGANYGQSPLVASVRVIRAKKPSDNYSPPIDKATGGSLPSDEEQTLWLDISQQGSQKRMRVPCGYQLEGRTTTVIKLNILIGYDKQSCPS